MIIFDFEVYPNWYHVSLLEGDAWHQFSYPVDKSALIAVITRDTLLGFNNRNYDNVILSAVLMGFTPERIYELSAALIKADSPSWTVRKAFGLDDLTQNPSLDLIDIQPLIAGRCGLKLLAARMHYPKLQELPFDPTVPLDASQQAIVSSYCQNDCRITQKLYQQLKPQLKLREDLGKKYHIDLRSSGDAAIAEKVLVAEYGTTPHLLKKAVVKHEVYQFKAPDFIQPKTQQVKALLNDMESASYKLGVSGRIITPDILKDRTVCMGDRIFKIGLGGLHSKDSSGQYKADENYQIVDVDVVSYYPNIIIRTGWHPEHMTERFNQTFKDLVDRRIEAKTKGYSSDAHSLKIVINSTFGKTGYPDSALFSPNLVIGITLTGQLALLMLIEAMDRVGLNIISANTDGITLCIKRGFDPLLMRICKNWEEATGFSLERSNYKLFAQRDINSYVSIGLENQIKTKGLFAIGSALNVNPKGDIIIRAVIEFLKSATPVAVTIMNSTYMGDFLLVRQVKGGAVKDDIKLGKVVRWYYSTATTTPIRDLKSKTKVAGSDRGMALQDLPALLPCDLDYERYIQEADAIVQDITQPKTLGMNSKALSLKNKGLSPAPLLHKGKTLYSDDFSSCEKIGTQTGEKCGLIKVERKIYSFTEKGWPGSFATVSKKLKLQVIFGGVTEIEDNEVTPLPSTLREQLFNALTVTQQNKIRTLNNCEMPGNE